MTVLQNRCRTAGQRNGRWKIKRRRLQRAIKGGFLESAPKPTTGFGTSGSGFGTGVGFVTNGILCHRGVSSSNAATFGIGAIQVAATAVTLWLIDKAGRRLLLIISSSGMTVSLLLVAVAFYLKDVVSKDTHFYNALGILSLVGLVAFVITFSLGMGAIPWIIMSEILPVNIKGLAGSIATLVNWLTSWVITMTANLLLTWSSGGTFTMYTVVSAFTVVFVFLYVPETKGRTLEEIQWSFR